MCFNCPNCPISEGFSWTAKLMTLHYIHCKLILAKNLKYDQFVKINTREIQIFLTHENKIPAKIRTPNETSNYELIK